MNRPRMFGQHKRAPGRKYYVLSGEASRKRRLSSPQLDALMVIKVDKFINQFSGMLEGVDFLTIDTLSFEYGEEIFVSAI